MSQMKDFYDFLVEAELQHYYNSFQTELKVTNVSQLKYVEDEDLVDMGMTKPEIRRLKKFFKKECPQGTFGKLKKRIMTKAQDGSSSSHSQSSGSPQLERVPSIRSSSSKHVISETAITLNKVLGNGEFGTVQQGVWVDDDGERIQVAVKCLCKEKVRSGTPDFLKEASIMHTIDHMYIVRLYGVVLKPESLWLVTELAPLRSLLECLKEPALRPSFPVMRLCEFCVQIASGMQYLETKRLIHRDLAARNILVFAKNKVKISDFGLSRALGVGKDYYQTNFSVSLKLPIAWCAPECINYLKFTSASDVWAYGVTIWEMFSYGFQPWAAHTGQQILDAIDEPNLERLEQPESCPKAYYTIMLKCWQHDPKQRPTFIELLPMLNQATPDQVKATTDMASVVAMKDFLQYKTDDVITVLDNKPDNATEAGLWKGVLPNGKVGLFKASDAASCQQLTPTHRPKSTVSRKVSSRKSAMDKKFNIAMISGPQNDMRHTGHVGYDGTTFGDVAFIVDNYDKLPKKTQPTTGSRQNDVTSSSVSLPTGSDATKSLSLPINGSKSEMSLMSEEKLSQGGSSSTTALSMTSHEDTLTDVSSMQDGDSSPKNSDNKYEEINDDDLDSFKMPELSTSLSFDLGPSFMDEVMRAITDPKKDSKPEMDEKSPLIEKDVKFPAASFDNIAMSQDVSAGLDTSTDTESDMPRDDGFMDSCSSMSSKASDDTRKENDTDKRKPRLKLKVSSFDREHQVGPRVKQLSASEEKKIDEAIELVNEFAQISTAEDMKTEEKPEHGSDTGSPGSSPRQRGLFSLRKKSSPKQERTFSDEIANLPRDLNEEVTPEAKEVYNMLVVQGSLKDKDDAHRMTRQMRARRSLEHQERETNGLPAVTAKPRNVNMNIRAPAGIPSRSNNARNASRTTVDTEEMDTNPLRRLRHIQVVAPRFRAPRSTDHDPAPVSKSNGHDSQSANLNPNMQFFAKLQEQERENEDKDGDGGGDIGGDGTDSTGSADCGSPNDIPLPPRRPLRPSVNRPPRQRKYPLDLSNYGHHHHQEDTARNGSDSENHISVASVTLSRCQSPPTSTDLSLTRESDDGVFSGSDSSSILEPRSELAMASPSHCLHPAAASAQFSVKSVSCSAAELGLFDNKDSFWSQKVNFDEMATESDSDLGDENSPSMSGRYKTSDNVSYEDLLEFALDGADKSNPDQNCDEVRLMRKVLSKDVTVEDCMYALQETEWEVYCAIKLLKLKQLLSTKLGTMDECKDALMQCQWNVEQAANQLLSHEPDLVHV